MALRLPLAWVAEVAGAEKAFVGDVMQSLWSGYGEIRRVHLEGAPTESVVVKCVVPPDERHHPRGWSGDRGHHRKLRSYEVERQFYLRHAALCAKHARLPRCHATRRLDQPPGWLFVFEDLDAAGFAERRHGAGEADVDVCLDWLATFHAIHLGREPSGLWPVGSYWHLETRPDELCAVDDARLRRAAPVLDRRLNECRFKTLVHGDAKLENFCFGDAGVAAVDFQYVGGGAGVKDVAYFFSSCWDGAECEALAPRHLDRYFELLDARLRQHRPELDRGTRGQLAAEWRSLYPIAWADFCRFLAGWAPAHWKLHDYSRGLLAQVLANLSE